MAKKNNECIFCKIAKGRIKAGKGKVGESNNFFAFYDVNPVTKGHTLVIPKKHFVTLLDIPNKLGEELLKFTKETAGKLMDDKIGDGFNVIMNNLAVAGQFVMHAHIHIIPRKEGDGIRTLRRKEGRT